MKLSISIVIPTFNGLSLIQEFLPTVIKHSHGARVIVVDDASSDETVAWLKANYPQVYVHKNSVNRGFSFSVNKGFSIAKTDLVMLLNNDVALKPTTLTELEKHFHTNSNLFAVGAKEILADGGSRGRASGKFSRGLLIHQRHSSSKVGPSLWVFGASGLFSLKVWRQLGGLDELYAPAYWEDIDIGYRAWKSGYSCWYEPKAEVYHQGESTMNQVLAGKKAAIVYRNQLLFYWKNISDWRLVLSHLLWTPYHVLVTGFRSRGAFVLGFLLALTKLGQVHSHQPSMDKISDLEIVKLVN